MLKLIIIDDEVDACRILRTYLEEYPTNGIELVGEANSLKTGIELIHSLEPDIVLLDINLGDGIAFELLDHFPDLSFRVIFTTAYDQFALKAFKYSAVDYLLKPIEPDQLTAALVKTKIHFQKDVDFQAQLKILLKNIRT